eukprot:6934873-Pyramimonas_sp.AAC.1
MLNAIVAEGQTYDFELNWAKTRHMHISTSSTIVRPDGGPKTVRDAVYIGGMFTCDGEAAPQVTSALGRSALRCQAARNIWVTYSSGADKNIQSLRQLHPG